MSNSIPTLVKATREVADELENSQSAANPDEIISIYDQLRFVRNLVEIASHAGRPNINCDDLSLDLPATHPFMQPPEDE